MMNVYDHIASNSRRTVLLLFMYPVVLFLTILAFIVPIIVYNQGADQYLFFLEDALQSTLMFTAVLLPMVGLWTVVSYLRGGKTILGMANAQPVTLEENRELFRLVENTAIMAGLPTPNIYLIEDESLNAFAVGRNPETATIAFTKGIVEKLERAELQAVIAHELAHIGNRDTRLMLITFASAGFFLFLSELLIRVGVRGAAGGRRGGKGGGKAVLLILLMALCCFVFGYVIAPVLRLAISRRREYQADATAVKITRDPDALARALTKIADNPRMEALSKSPLVGNMCIANPTTPGFFRKLYSTHPPIDDRILALERMGGKVPEPHGAASLLAQPSLFFKVLSILFTIIGVIWTLLFGFIAIVGAFVSEDLAREYPAIITFALLAGLGALLLYWQYRRRKARQMAVSQALADAQEESPADERDDRA